MDSDSVEHPPFSQLNCPAIRFEYSRPRISDENSNFLMIDIPYYSSHYDYFSRYRHPLRPLYWCNNKKSRDDFWCGACKCKEIGTSYYFCGICEVAYHKECVESPLLIKSPYHPKHHLQLFMHHRFLSPSDDLEIILSCFYCDSKGRRYRPNLFYCCLICNFSLDPVCARKPSFLNYPKRHEHTLNHFPRKTDLLCDVCGIIDSKSLIYVCLQCDFFVHKSCIHLPFVIRISRHDHRLSFTYSPQRMLSCGVCRQKVEQDCGKYSCMKDCTYVVHSKCATRSDVWDGKELDEEPEEVHENFNSYEVIAHGVIQHFSHSHHMRFEKKTTDIVYNENDRCQACVLPFYGGDVYKCMNSTCDFVLHEGCANLPRTKQHMAHPYPFILQVSDTKNCFFCGYCDRFSCGFRYVCCKGAESISLDVRCAAISEPFDHPCHSHPLFLSNELGKSRPCSMCGKENARTLNCIECDFFLCFYCATIPYKVRYEHDEHFLTLSYDENASLNWCEVCEETLDSNKWLYTCNECGVVFHIACLIRKSALYVKPAQDLLLDDVKFNIILNNGLTRPICDECGSRCQDKLMLHMVDDDNEEEARVCYRHWEVGQI